MACEAYHGPSQKHVHLMQKTKFDWKPFSDSSFTKFGLTRNFHIVDRQKQVENYARCHSKRTRITQKEKWDGIYLNHYQPVFLNYPEYHYDGQINEKFYVYGSFLQSKMYQKGVVCTNCHNPHSNKIKFEGNQLCTQCHNPQNKKYNFIKEYDSPQHHNHSPNSSGSQCINCHMPGKTYMGIDFRRDHSFSIPNPKLSSKINSSNACNQCHQNRTSQWKNEQFKNWYPKNDKETKSYGEILYNFSNNRSDKKNN